MSKLLEKGAKGLKLESNKNNCHELTSCPNPVGFFQGIFQGRNFDDVTQIRGNVACKSWKCPFCNPNNTKKLRFRIYNSKMVLESERKGFRGKYDQKFLTLTCPGKNFRKKYTSLDAYNMMAKAFHKLKRAIEKKNGRFEYYRHVEPQVDGFPHFHVVIVGPGIASKKVLQEIRDLWCIKYGMGFVKMNVITKSIVHAIRYITKYLSKNPVSMGKNKRIFTASKEGLAPVDKKEWIKKEFYYGVVRPEHIGGSEVIERRIDIEIPGGLDHVVNHMSDKCFESVFGVNWWEDKIRFVNIAESGAII